MFLFGFAVYILTGQLKTALASVIMVFLVIVFVETLYLNQTNWQDANTEFNSQLGWAPVKNRKTYAWHNKTITTNKLGFRSESVNLSKEHILIIGDSVAWGFGVSDDETIAHYLNNKVDDKYQVFNLGVSGYGVDQTYLFLKNNIAKTNPKHIVYIIYSGNDILDTQKNHAYGKSKPLFSIVNYTLTNVYPSIQRSSCFNLFSKSYLLNKFIFLKSIKEKICNEKKLSDSDTKKVIKLLLLEIKNLAKEQDSNLIFVLHPSIGDYTKQSTHHLFFKDLLESEKYNYIDVHKIVNERDIDITELYLDFRHYTPKGNEFLSQLIYSVIG